jgi:uncharacterized protein involved in outer membrane biogenesis
MNRRRILALAAGVLLLVLAVLAVVVHQLLGGDRIKAAIEAQAAAALGRPVTITTATPRFLPRIGLDLDGISIGAGREVSIDSVRLTTGFRALLGGRVANADLLVERSSIDVRWAIGLMNALGAANGAAAPSTGAALAIDSIDSLVLREVTLLAGPRPLVVDLEGAFTAGDRFLLRRMHGRAEGSDLTISGEMSSLTRRTGEFDVAAETLDLDGLMAFFTAATPAGADATAAAASAPPLPSAPLHLDLDIRARKGHALGIAFTDLSTKSQVRGSAAMFDALKMAIFGGTFDGGIGLDGSGREPRFDWRGKFAGLDVPALVAFAGSPGTLTGRLGGTVAISAAGADPVTAMRRARGTARVVINDGKVPHLDLVRTAVLAFGRPAGDMPAGSGEAFSQLAASLAVAGQTLSTRDLTFASRDLDMNGSGTLSLATEALDVYANLVLSRELSAQSGRDLYRLAREGDRVVVPAHITGSVASPSVMVDVKAALQRAIRNRAEDEIRNFFNRLGKPK